jgi:hypothetical protein
LLYVSWIKVDGELVYKAQPKAATETASDQGPAASEAPAAGEAAATDAPTTDAETNTDAPAVAKSF